MAGICVLGRLLEETDENSGRSRKTGIVAKAEEVDGGDAGKRGGVDHFFFHHRSIRQYQIMGVHTHPDPPHCLRPLAARSM